MHTFLIGVLLAVVALAGSAEAFPSSRLIYVREAGAEQCPDEGALRMAVRTRLGYDPFFPSAERTIVLVIAPDPVGRRAKVYLVDSSGLAKGLREFTAAPNRCGDLVYAAALSISIAIDPTAADAPPTPRVASPEEPLPTAPGPPAVLPVARAPADSLAAGDHPARERATAPERTPPRAGAVWSLGLGGVGSLGVGPVPTAGGVIFGSVRVRDASFTLEASADWPAAADEQRFRFWTLRLNAAPCLHWSPWLACLVGSAGRLAAEGTALGSPAEQGAFLFSSGLRGGYELLLSDALRLRLHAEGLVTLVQVGVTSSGTEVWKAPPFSASGGAALAFHF